METNSVQDPPDARVLEGLEQLVRSFQAAGRAILPGTNDELLQPIVEAAARIFGAAAASIALVDTEQQCLAFVVSFGAGQSSLVGMRIPINQGIAGYVAMTGQPLAVSNVRQDPRFAQSVAQSTGYVPHSILAMPLLLGEQVIGVIEVLDKLNAPSFGMQDMELLGLFARQAAVAIHQSQQYDLLGLGLLRCLERVVNLADRQDLGQVFRALLDQANADATTQGRAQHELIALADLYYQLGQLGEAERQTALKVLTSFRDYARDRLRVV